MKVTVMVPVEIVFNESANVREMWRDLRDMGPGLLALNHHIEFRSDTIKLRYFRGVIEREASKSSGGL